MQKWWFSIKVFQDVMTWPQKHEISSNSTYKTPNVYNNLHFRKKGHTKILTGCGCQNTKCSLTVGMNSAKKS